MGEIEVRRPNRRRQVQADERTNTPLAPKRMRPPQSKPRRKRQPFKTVKVICLMVLVLFVLSLCAVFFLPAFRITTIDVKTNGLLTKEAVLAKTELKQGQRAISGFSLWQFSYKRASAAVLANFPETEKVTARYVYPSKIAIEITERIPIFCIRRDKGYVQIDKNGVAIREGLTPPEGLPQLAIPVKGEIAMGKPVPFENQTMYPSAAEVLRSMVVMTQDNSSADTLLLQRIVSLTATKDGLIYLVFRLEQGQMLTVKLKPDDGMAATMRWIVSAIENKVLKGRGNGMLDTTAKPRPIFTPNEGIPKEVTGETP